MDCRLLVHLLNYGSPEETGDDVSELFKGGKDWVASCSSISSPHDGTSLTVLVNNYFPQVRDLILSIASVLGLDTDSHLYNFKLEQWGITRMPGESFAEFFDRVFHSGAWTAKKDISIWDLRPDGAAEFNDYVITAPHVYYFTYSTDATRTSLIDNKIAVASLDMIPILWPIANIMGFFDRVNAVDVPVNATWHPNDGVVNTISMQGPTVGFNVSRDVPEIIQVNTSTIIDTGIFYHMPVLSGWDHMAIIGVGLWKILPFYTELASMLASLPDHTSLEDKFRYSPKPFEREYSAEGIYASKDASPCDTSAMFSKVCEGASPIMGEKDCQALKADIAKLDVPNDWCSSEKSVNAEILKIAVQYLRSASQ
jgi:triacylglycerol lipase